MAMLEGVRRVIELKIAHLPKVCRRHTATLNSRRLIHACLHQVTDMGFMGMRAPSLVTLDVSGLALTDIGLAWISEGSPRLENAIMHECEKLSELGLTSLAERCSSLRKIDLGDNRGLSGDWLKALSVGFGRSGRSLTWVSTAAAHWVVPLLHSRRCHNLVRSRCATTGLWTTAPLWPSRKCHQTFGF